jgi:alpha-tubulin suppressor-like RCC1 family protein
MEKQPAAPSTEGPLLAISDAVHGDGLPGFYFLPPMVAPPTFAGTFDAGLQPVVEVCAWSAGVCTARIAMFTTETGPGSETVRLVLEDEHYIVNWHTDQFELDPTRPYRIRVLVAGAELGFADVEVAADGRELKNVNTEEFIPLLDGRTLPIKFRIEVGTVYVVGPAGGSVASRDGNLTLTIPEGILTQPTGLTIQPADDVPPDPGLVGGTAYSLGPEGTQFAPPGVTITIRYDPSSVPVGVSETSLRLQTHVGGEWQEVPGSHVDRASHTVSGPATQFSMWAAGCTAPCVPVPIVPENPLLEPYLRSIQSALPATIKFVNTTAQTLRVYWLDFSGQRVLYNTLAPSQSYFQLTFLTHPWVVTDAAGTALAIFQPDGDVDVSEASSFTPQPLEFSQVATGSATTCGRTIAGLVYCWGRNTLGVVSVPLPLRVPVTRQFRSVTVGWGFACALADPATPNGNLFCWGENRGGQLGLGITAIGRIRPTQVLGPTYLTVSAGIRGACAVAQDGRAFCWGSDRHGELGDGVTSHPSCTLDLNTYPCSRSPQEVGPGMEMAPGVPLRFAFVDTYLGSSCGLTRTLGKIFCWGDNTRGQLGIGTRSPIESHLPLETSMATLPAGVTYRFINIGRFHACAIGTNNGAYCWGTNEFSALGLGAASAPETCGGADRPCSTTPLAVAGDMEFRVLSAGEQHTCAITPDPDKALLCWGSNLGGEIGDGSAGLVSDRASPTSVSGARPASWISAGEFTSCGVLLEAAGPRAYCWGDNAWGQLGNGRFERSSVPVRVSLQP